MTRPAEPVRRPVTRWLAIAAAALVAFAGVGCGVKSAPPPGGANSEKARDARKQAETSAMSAVMFAAQAQAEAVPGVAKAPHKSLKQKAKELEQRVENWVSNTPTPPPAAPAPPKKPNPPMTPATPMPPAPAITARPDPEPIPKAFRGPGQVVIREKVSSDLPYFTESEAEESALLQAQKRVAELLSKLDPPVRYEPSLAVVKNEFVRKETRAIRKPTAAEQEEWKRLGYSPDRVFVEYEVVVTADQVRELRSQDRVSGALKVFGGLAAVALAAFLFLRFDEWTKGYLTSWLAFLAVALAVSAAAALVLA